MNPLSPFTYYRRHKRRALMLTALLALTIMGLYLFIGLAQETYIAPAYTINRYLEKFYLVQPDLVPALEPDVIARIHAHPDVSQVLPQNDIRIKVANVGGANFPFRLIGLKQEEVSTVLAQSNVSLKEGRLPHSGMNEVALSEEIVAALKLSLGDSFDRTKDEKAYPNIVSPLKLVGILSGGVRLGIMSYEYLDSDENYRDLADAGLLVIARPGREAAVADFLIQSVRNPRTKTYTYQSVSDQVSKDQSLLYTLGIPIVLLVTVAITLVVSAINRLAFSQRLTEFGALYALGHSKGWLAQRLVLEMAVPALASWVVGILLAWGALALLSMAVYAPIGFAFEAIPLTALSFVTCVPLAVIGFTLFTAVRTFGRLDAIAVVERGELSLEEQRSGKAARLRPGNLPRPLASITFYRRHVRQAAVLIAASTLLILGTALLFFVFAAGTDALQPTLNNFSRMSAVSPNNQPLEASVIDQIQAHPTVARVIEVYAFPPVRISIPPMFPDQPVEALCVTAEDMAYLVDLYHLQLATGQLPRPNTNELVIPWVVAKNRNIKVGDVIGDPAQPIYPGAPSLPIEVVVSGIFAPAENLADATWLSFMSLEYVDQYRESNLSLIVVPRPGQKAALDTWLEGHIAGENHSVLTSGIQQAALQKEMRAMLFTFSLMEIVIALVAALTIAGLNYIFLTQRQAELGVLNALGFDRLQLVGRLMRETSFTTGVAWLASMIGCLFIVFVLQQGLFASIGLRLNLFNPTPWLFTLPIPVTVLIASGSMISRMLAKLDPVTTIEKR